MNTLNYEILNDIDRIDQCVMEAEMNVIDSLIETYTKSAMILENYNGNDYSSFDIFQEGSSVNNTTKKPKMDNKFKHNLLDRIMQFFRNAVTKISLKLLDVKFDIVLKKLEKFPKDKMLLSPGKIHEEITWDHLFDNLDKSINFIEYIIEISQYILSNTNSDVINDNIRDFEYNKDANKSWDEAHSACKKTVVNKDLVEYVGVDELIDVISSEKQRLDSYKEKIHKLLKDMNKVFKTAKFTEMHDVESISVFKKLINTSVKSYIISCKEIIYRSNEFIKIGQTGSINTNNETRDDEVWDE